MSPKKVEKRIERGRKALAGWADRSGEIDQALIEAELGALEGLLNLTPNDKLEELQNLILRYRKPIGEKI